MLKFLVLYVRQNPTIATFPVDTKFDPDNPLDLNEINLKLAFQFNYYDETTSSIVNLNDPNYVKMITILSGYDKDGYYFAKTIPHHECTEEEYNEFYPIISSHVQIL